MRLNRRGLLRGLGAVACSAAAHPMLSTVTLAQGAPVLGENRLVVIILRGAMDGLDALRPADDPLFAGLRPALSAVAGVDLAGGGGWQMHGALAGLLPLWQAGELAFVQACSTPYRDKRSHFDGQDLLEAGTGADVALGSVRDGWLNRMLQAVPGVSAETAYAVGRDEMRLLAGGAPVRNWAPDQGLGLSAQGRLLWEAVAHDDPLFRDAVAEALALTGGGMDGMQGADGAGDVGQLVEFVAGRLRGESRIAAFSLTGWDTHKAQANTLKRPLARLEQALLGLRAGLGDAVWGRTAVLAMTEFGRTARENGSGGTDHGTGGLMLAAGGAVRGGQVLGDWPGLSDAALYEGRDLMPTTDVRAWAAHAMAALYGLDRAVLEQAVFPGLRIEGAGGLIL